jgi:hypothetical protein
MAHSIHYPSSTTYFITKVGNLYACGQVDPDQWMDTGLDIIEKFTEKDLYLARINELGIILEE